MALRFTHMTETNGGKVAVFWLLLHFPSKQKERARWWLVNSADNVEQTMFSYRHCYYLVFPLPLGPRMMRNSPLLMGNEGTEEFREMLRRTGISLPSWSLYDFFRSVMITISSSEATDSATEPLRSLIDSEFYMIETRIDSPFWGEDIFQHGLQTIISLAGYAMDGAPLSLSRDESARRTRALANRTEEKSGCNYRWSYF